MPQSMVGRRVASVGEIEQAGDYCGPVMLGDELSCLFLPPTVADATTGLWRVAFPPHTYRECEDGSLEVRASIVAIGRASERLWHGFLDEGHRWRSV